MMFNLEAAVVLGIIAALFYGFCALFPAFSYVGTPFVLAALTLGIGGAAEFFLGMQPRVGLVMPVWGLGVGLFALNIMISWGPLPFYALLITIALLFYWRRVSVEKMAWRAAQRALRDYEADDKLPLQERGQLIRSALFCTTWTRTRPEHILHNQNAMIYLLRDLGAWLTPGERSSIDAMLAALASRYRQRYVRQVKDFLEQKAESHGIGQFRAS
ncbi:hypothetical protein F2P45_14555 [Massilia sp. CCM 8733]|uniref:Uncharacterized protein n=1 Tax=Massilia mucilaginosa TaxID=2609282 RepID=A0ABX0NTU0_9BURK|nr:hypothetical protein [Massilia mucilaginosa]NHZ90226.1 hypothetical protein [Massilia mucilaginosa]